MALAPITPRDKLERLVDLGRKTLRYWWLVALFAVGGGALSMLFAMTRPRSYQCEAVLGYEEKIQSSLLSNREEAVNRFLGDRYRELLMARPQLIQIIQDPKLNPYPDKDPDLALEKLRQQVRFESKGGANFRISYADSNPERAQAVTLKLTKLLQEKDEAMRSEQAQNTVAFATTQKEEAAKELSKREQDLAQFLATHPEFAQDPNQQSAEGAGIRAVRNKKAAGGNTRLDVLERQRARLQARLDAPPDAPPIRISAPATPEKIAAEAAVADAQRELNAANRELEDARSKYTEKHPAVIAATDRIDTARQRLRQAKAAVPPDIETTVAPATPADRTRIQKDLAAIESQIADEQKRTGKTETPADAGTSWVVKLETQYADLRRAMTEQRETVDSLADSVRRAQMDASAKAAEGGGGRLTVINPAEKPTHPSGPGKTIFLLAGMVLFISLGATLAVGLAVIDDRLYRRADIDQLGIAVLAVIPPGRARTSRSPNRGRAA